MLDLGAENETVHMSTHAFAARTSDEDDIGLTQENDNNLDECGPHGTTRKQTRHRGPAASATPDRSKRHGPHSSTSAQGKK